MGLFTKKDPCAICGGKVTGLFPWKVDDQLICKECFSLVDLPIDEINKMKIDEFRNYLNFRKENALLKEQFQTTQIVDFGAFEDKIAFDMVNGMFCMHTELVTTIFERKDIKSFVIREDDKPLFAGSAAGLVCYTSTVSDRVAAMAPVFQQMRIVAELKKKAEQLAREADEDFYSSQYDQNVEEPFEKFVVEIQCDHPYWKTITADKQGPTFNDDCPSVQQYLREYQEGVAIMGQLARALMEVAFPGAPEQSVGANATVVIGQTAAPAAPVDAVAEIKRYKDLLEQGIITEEEFKAKKSQLLGI